VPEDRLTVISEPAEPSETTDHCLAFIHLAAILPWPR